MPVAEWVTGEQVPAEVKWAYRMEHCPLDSEFGRCTGHLVIYAYLQTVEERSTVLSTIIPWVDHEYYEWKILPMKFEEIFKIQCVNVVGQLFGGDAGRAYAADHCRHGVETPAPSPKRLGEAQFQYAVPASATMPEVPATSGTEIRAKTTFSWQQGIVLVSLPPGTGGTFDIPGLGEITIGASGGQVTAGPTHSIEVDWTITWHGSGVCTVTTSPQPNTTIDEAIRVFGARHSARKLPGNPNEED